jgi:integrase
MKYLTKTSNDYYKLRIRIPKALQVHFRRNEINKSLNTTNFAFAKKQALSILNDYQKICLMYQLKLNDENYIEKYIKDFSINHLNSNYNEYTNKTLITHKIAFDKFKSYYEALDINETKKRAVLVFLEEIFLPLIGKKELVANITFDNLNKIKAILQNLPRRNLSIYKDMSLTKLINMKIKDTDKINVATLNGYMKRISRFYNFCFASQYTTINPCLFVTKDKSQVSDREEREAFTKEDISKLIPIIKKYDIHKQVIYFSLMFTGLRISELYKAQIKQHNENEFYFDLIDSNIKLKTKNSHRIIPLHKELIKMDVQTILPKALELNKINWIRRLFNEKIKVKITSSKKKVLYSFRHTVASELKYLNVKSEIISEILGHTNSNITLDRYASRYSFEVLKKEIDSIEFTL